MADTGTIRKRLEIQDFHGLDDAALAEIGPLIYQTLFARRNASQA